jgi:hypothetical protein
MYGAEIRVDGVFAGITIGTNTLRVRRGKIYGGIVRHASGGAVWTAGGVGYKLLKANNCTLQDVSAVGLEKGIEVTSPAPPNASETTQNWITPVMLADCALPIYLFANDSGTVNENTFFGGEISYSGGLASAVGRYAITMQTHAAALGNLNGTKFFGTYVGCSMLSNRPNAVYCDGVGSAFHACHIEGFPIPMVTFAGNALVGGLPNMFWGGGANYLAPEVDLDSDGVGIAAPFIFSGQDGAGVAGGVQAASAYVWVAKVLGAANKIGLAVKDAADALTFTVRGDGIVTSGKSTVEGAYRVNGPVSNRSFVWQTAGVARWDARANATAEGGANAGSDWSLNCYTDAGAALSVPLTITRSTGAATFSHAIRSTSASGGVGYTTGAGGTVTQGAGSGKATAVTLDKMTGLITMNNANLNAATIVSFVLNIATLLATDLIVATHESGGTLGAYTVNARATGAGTAAIDVRNNTAGNLAEALVIRFAVIKSVSA